MKALGGCSSMNAMVYIRGNRADYDEWRDAYGATGWGYDDVLPYFKKAEGNTRLGDPYHGTDGPLHVEDRRYTHELSHAFVESAVAAGFKRNDDFNGAEQEGAGLYQVTCKKGRRWSVADAYIHPASKRSNFTVRTEAFVMKIDMEGNRATGVTYRRGGVTQTTRANAEIVLSAGAVASPQLLMLSGIGPGGHLREHGIDVNVDVAGVGQNLQDHPVSRVLFYTKDTTDLAELLSLGNVLKAQKAGRGAAHLQRARRPGAFFKSRADMAAPRPAVPHGAERLLRQRPARARTTWAHHRVDTRARREHGLHQAALGGPDVAPRDRSGLLRRRRRPRRHDCRISHGV